MWSMPKTTKREPSGSPKPSTRPKGRAKARRRRPRLKLYAMHWQQRNKKQKSRYRKSLSVVDRVREGTSFSAACREQQVSRATVRRYLGKVLYRGKGNRIRARRHDKLFRNMELVESGGHILFVELNDSEQATKLSSYHTTVKRFLHEGDAELLATFKNDGVVDSAMVLHKFETSTKKILELYERRENFPEEYEIYQQ
jgi:hypothetical protein